jgi:type VI secretion system secreted protein Hcp
MEMKRLSALGLVSLIIVLLLAIYAGCENLPVTSPESSTPPSSPESSTATTEIAPAASESTLPAPEDEVEEPLVHSSAYIKFDGVDGEAMSKGHDGWSEIVSFNQQITSPSSGATDISRRRGDVILEDIIIVKAIDKASPKLAEAICKGKVYTTVEIHLTGPSAGSTCEGIFYAYELKNVMITSYRVTGSNPLAYALIAPAPDSILPYSGPFIVQAVDVPMEEISLNFEEIKVTYTECDTTGKSKGNIEYSWKVEEGES